MRVAVLCGVGLVVAGTVAAQEERREVAAHVHGESVLRIAIEGDRVILDFDAPGLDIVGFEHTPATAEEMGAVEKAKAALAQPLALFDFGVAAGCAVATANVEFLIEEHDHRDEAAAPQPLPGPKAHAGQEGEEITNHTGFEGAYELTCANIGAARELKLGFLAMFPNAMVVEVQLVTAKGQTRFDVERPAISASLAGLI